VPKLFEMDDPDDEWGPEAITAVPAFDVEAFARASELQPTEAAPTAIAPVTDANEAPALEVSTEEVEIEAFDDSEKDTRHRVRRILGFKDDR
jgi:hypothetical protein